MTFNKPFSLKSTVVALGLMFGAMTSAYSAVSIIIQNGNAPGVGFNDPTPATPVGGNPGTTLGEQRLFAFTYAANIWGATLTSNVPVKVFASFVPLACTANSGTLGSAGATSVFLDFPGALKPGTLYGGALANKLAGFDQTVDEDNPDGTAQIVARFNSNLGLNANCLPGSPFYLGVDNNHGDLIDFTAVLLHELGHGLGFQTFTSGLTGNPFAGFPSIWDHFLLDNRTNKLWTEMVPQERIDSAISVTGLSWNGANVTAAAPKVLSKASSLNIRGRAFGNVKGDYEVGDASFGPPIGATPLEAPINVVIDQEDGVTGLACLPLNEASAAQVKGNIALVTRGACGFTVKAKNVQNAGAVGMIVVDNVEGAVAGLGGSDATITIPSVRVTKADGELIKARQLTRENKKFGLVAKFELSKTKLAGSDNQGRVLVNTPNPFQPGSSVSHYTTATKPNQLMEPAINGDLTQSVVAPFDLTFELFKDIGW
jgi:PA domain